MNSQMLQALGLLADPEIKEAVEHLESARSILVDRARRKPYFGRAVNRISDAMYLIEKQLRLARDMTQ